MKPKRFFWGMTFIALGSLFLVRNLFHAEVHLFSFYKLWPFILVLLGGTFLIKEEKIRYVLSGLAGLVLGLVIFSLTSSSCNFFNTTHDFNHEDFGVVNFVEPANASVRRVNLDLHAGAGGFFIEPGDSNLIEVVSVNSHQKFNIDKTISDTSADFSLEMKNLNIKIDNEHTAKNGIGIKLNTKPVYTADIEIGAAAINFDFSKIKLQELNIKMGAASLDLKLGKAVDSESQVNIEAGASSIHIFIPSDAAVEIETDMVLSSKELGGLKETSDNTFQTEGFEKASKKMHIKVDSGVSSLTVLKY